MPVPTTLPLDIPSWSAITSAFLLKLTTSLDDLLWLSPFLSLSPSVSNKLKHSVVYFLICVCVTMLAFVFGTTLLALTSRGEDGKEPSGYWNPERLLSVFSASVLFCIARNDFAEWKEENYEHHGAGGVSGHRGGSERRSSSASGLSTVGEMETIELVDYNNYGSSSSNNNSSSSNGKPHHSKLRSRSNASRSSSQASGVGDLEAGGSFGSDGDDSDSDDEEIRAKIEEASKSLRRFVTVCVMGTLDDMIVFSAFVAGGAGSAGGKHHHKHSNLALFIGTTLAALLIVTISWFFSEIDCFKRAVKKIPMWALLSGIAVYILAMGLL